MSHYDDQYSDGNQHDSIHTVTFHTGAQKYDNGKLRFDLIPPEVDKALAEVYTMGTKRHADRNWEKGIPYSACLASHKRHLNKYERGQKMNTEDEGGLEELKHALFWMACLVTYEERRMYHLNDLPAYKEYD